MRTFRRRAVLASLSLAAACASPGRRIAAHRAAFDAYPPAVQEKIRAGRADVGFTREQAELALGKPDRRYTRAAAGADQEIWVYRAASRASRLDLGFGMGSWGGGGGYGGGLGLGTGLGSPREGDERVRIVFQDGAAVSVETRAQ